MNVMNVMNVMIVGFVNVLFNYVYVIEVCMVDVSWLRGLMSVNILILVMGIICWDILFEFKIV